MQKLGKYRDQVLFRLALALGIGSLPLLNACNKPKKESIQSIREKALATRNESQQGNALPPLPDLIYSKPGTLHRIDPKMPILGTQKGDPDAVPDLYVHPKSNSTLCFGTANRSNEDGNFLQLQDCSFEFHQQIRISPQGHITAQWMCIGFDGLGQAVLTDCGGSAPVFVFEGNHARKKDTDQCLALSAMPAIAGLILTLHTCSADDIRQTFSFGKKSFESLTLPSDPAAMAANEYRTPPPVDEVIKVNHNPPVAGDNASYAHLPLDAQIFPTDDEWIRYTTQSMFGDCSALTVITSMAMGARDLLLKTIYKVGPRSYEVQLFWQGRRVALTIDDQLPIKGQSWFAAAPSADARTGNMVIYVSLIEKAMTLLREAKGAEPGYNNLIDTQDNAIAQLLGVESIQTNQQKANWTESDLEALITEGLRKKGVVVAAILGPANDLELPSGHAYSVVGISRKGDEVFLSLRNPWGFDGWKPTTQFSLTYGNAFSTFTITLKEFMKTYSTLDVANLPDL